MTSTLPKLKLLYEFQSPTRTHRPQMSILASHCSVNFEILYFLLDFNLINFNLSSTRRQHATHIS